MDENTEGMEHSSNISLEEKNTTDITETQEDTLKTEDINLDKSEKGEIKLKKIKISTQVVNAKDIVKKKLYFPVFFFPSIIEKYINIHFK